jgi:hypothetical protein
MATKTPVALGFAAVFALAPITAEATISRAMSFDDKVEKAASIVVGRCVAQQSRWDAAHNWILTYSTFQVEKTLKGLPSQQITIVTPGGQVENIAQDVIGVPKFSKGDDHVVFVRSSQAGPTVLFLDQGAYRVMNEDGERMVRPLVTSAVLVDTQRGMAVAPEQPRRLRDFETSVRDTIRRREAMRMDMMERQKRQQASIWSQVQRNKILVALALIGAALATWQLVKRY